MNKILIIGANSFIGESFIEYKKIASHVEQFDIKSREISSIDLKDYNTIIHLAAIVHSDSRLPKELYFNVNSDLAYKVAKQAKYQGVNQFVFLSSIKVYGENTKRGETWNEDTKCLPKDYYGQSKLDAEQRILDLHDEDFTVSIVRSAVVYGPKVKANILSLIKLVSRISILPFASIENQRTFVFIENLIATMDCIIQQKVKGIFLATDSTTISTTFLVNEIAKKLNKKIWLFKLPFKRITIWLAPFLNKLFSDISINNDQTVHRLNLTLPYTFEEGLNKTIDWYKTTYLK